MIAIPTFNFIYEQTSDESPLRRYIAANCAFLDSRAFYENAHGVSYEMLINYAAVVSVKDSRSEIKSFRISDYFVQEG